MSSAMSECPLVVRSTLSAVAQLTHRGSPSRVHAAACGGETRPLPACTSSLEAAQRKTRRRRPLVDRARRAAASLNGTKGPPTQRLFDLCDLTLQGVLLRHVLLRRLSMGGRKDVTNCLMRGWAACCYRDVCRTIFLGEEASL